MKNSILKIFLVVILLSCIKKYEYQYYESGEIKVKAETRENKRHGVLFEYYPDGVVKSRQIWKKGFMNGPFVDFYENGGVQREGGLKNRKMEWMMLYHPNGKPSHKQFYDVQGNILSVEKYNEDGIRDSIPYPFFYFIPYTDTMEVGAIASFQCKIVNIVDSSFKADRLIITSAFDSTSGEGLRLLDTMQIVYPKGNNYSYEFTAKTTGENFIFGDLVIKKEDDDFVDIFQHRFAYPYFVVE